MGYSELIKNFDRIREYMRQFYVYGFRSRSEYDRKSARSYDNERRRIESWLGDLMGFRQRADGRSVFLSVDSRSIPVNPLYNAFRAKSFTDGDVTFHFYVLDLLADGREATAQELLDGLSREYLSRFDGCREPDLSTLRKKLKEYTELGLLQCRRSGRELYYRRSISAVDLEAWREALAFFTGADPLGVVGTFLPDRQEDRPDWFRFKHNYMLHALDSAVLEPILTAMGEHRSIRLANFSPRSRGQEMIHWVYPLHIWISTQNGRQYLMCYHYGFRKMMFFRLDYIQRVEVRDPEPRHEQLKARCGQFRQHLWGTSGGAGFRIDHFEMVIRCGPGEDYIPRRLEREKRTGTLEDLGDGRWRFTADVYDASELMPWVRTFLGRIERIACSNPEVQSRFRESLAQMYAMYGGDDDDLS